MTDKEMIDALQTLLKPINNRLETMELKLENVEVKLDTLRLDTRTANRSLKKDIQGLNDEVDTLIAVLEAKNILPMIK